MELTPHLVYPSLVRWLHALGCSLLVLSTGCYTMVVDGITVMEDDYATSRDAILSHASTAMSCPREQLETKLLTVTVHANVERMVVQGCDAKVVYLRTPDGFAPE